MQNNKTIDKGKENIYNPINGLRFLWDGNFRHIVIIYTFTKKKNEEKGILGN